jgi:hypothetical protein
VQKRGRYFSVLKVKINRKTAMKDESVKSKKGTRALLAACSLLLALLCSGLLAPINNVTKI